MFPKMNTNRLMLLLLGVMFIIGLLYWRNTTKPATAPVVVVPPQTTAPARDIPAQVTHNMQQALAEREKKLQQLTKSSQ